MRRARTTHTSIWTPAALVEAVASEAGTTIKVVQLYEGSVGLKGSRAETCPGMMTTNARLIADALK